MKMIYKNENVTICHGLAKDMKEKYHSHGTEIPIQVALHIQFLEIVHVCKKYRTVISAPLIEIITILRSRNHDCHLLDYKNSKSKFNSNLILHEERRYKN